MQILIHRGAEEIGGNCIEVRAEGKRLLLDLGAPLMGSLHGKKALPAVPGLEDGTNPDLLGIIISHPHADHYGLVSYAHPAVPVYIGAEACRMLKAAADFGPFGAVFTKSHSYKDRQPFTIGPFAITPYLVDHSAFDAYAFLIEASGKRLFYSGDLRGHGWKKGTFERLLKFPPPQVDAMLLEGTALGRSEEAAHCETEAELVEKIKHSLVDTKGILLGCFSGQNIDRLVTFFKAARASGRIMVIDLYMAHLLKAIDRKSLPAPGENLRVFLPSAMKRRIARDERFHLTKPFYRHRIYPEEIEAQKPNILMAFRSSMIGDLEKMGKLNGGKLIYSMWSGYLEQQKPDLFEWCKRQGLGFEIIHTSGHATKQDLQRLVRAINPKTLIPIHTLAHEAYEDFGSEVRHCSNNTVTTV